MNKKKILATLLAAVMTAGVLAGCGGGSNAPAAGSSEGGEAAPAASTGSEDYDFYIFNTKGESADAMQAAADAYSEATGQKVKVFSLGSGTDSSELMRTELASKNPPSIFCVMNTISLVEYTEGGYALNLADATDPDFQQLVADIPENLRLSDENGSYGIPFNIEGYGYIVDKRMIAAVYGEDKVDAWLEAYKTATYDEFVALVEATTDYIKNDTLGTVTLSGESFEMQPKSGLAENLVGTFSMAGSQTWTYGDHLVNVFIDAAFKDAAATANATAEQVDAMKPIFEAYAQVVDLKSSNATIDRGPELINTTTSGYDASVQNFADGKSFFLKQGNWVYTNLVGFNEEASKELTFVPIKVPLTDDMILTDGLTADYMNKSISVFVPNYYVINKKVSQEEQEKAEKFLVWLNTTPEGQKFVIEDMAFVPYNADPAVTSSGYCLGDSLLEYVAAGNTITNAYAGCPASWTGPTLGNYVMENYLCKAEWPENAYEDIADYAISTWKEMGGLE